MTDFYHKYQKYKLKYIQLKNQLGGLDPPKINASSIFAKTKNTMMKKASLAKTAIKSSSSEAKKAMMKKAFLAKTAIKSSSSEAKKQ